jgi:large conductance mechanosensitive channel
MGAAFGKVVTAFVEKCFAPITGLLLGGIDLNSKKLVLKHGVDAVKDATGAVMSPAVAELAISWGEFITACIDFVVVAFVMFLIIKWVNRSKVESPPAPSSTDTLLEGILNELKKGK